VTVSLGAIATHNNANSGTFTTDLSFLGFGSNNGSLTGWATTGNPGDRQILTRIWKVTETGTNNTNYSLSVSDNSSLNSTKLPAESQLVYLLVDTDTNFAAGATEYAMTLSGTEWILNGLDLNEGQFYTFATQTPNYPGNVTASSVVNGIHWELYNGFDATLDNITGTLLQNGYTDSLINPDDIMLNETPNSFALILRTQLNIATGGNYRFSFPVDDYGMLYINGNFVVSGNNATINSAPINIIA